MASQPPKLKLTATAERVPPEAAPETKLFLGETTPLPRVTQMHALWVSAGLDTMWRQSTKAERAQLTEKIFAGK